MPSRQSGSAWHQSQGPVSAVRLTSGQRGRDSPPETPTETVLDPALLPLLHGVGLIGRAEHSHAATPGGSGQDGERQKERAGEKGISTRAISIFFIQSILPCWYSKGV